MKTLLKLFAVTLLLSVMSCKDTSKKELEINIEEKAEPDKPTYHIQETWINKRVNAAQNKLSKTDAGKALWKSMEAHGGLKRWFSNGYLSFRFNYQPLSGKGIRDSYQTIDTWSNKARHNSIEDPESIYGWDGKQAWVKAKDSMSFKYDTKFWALTPLYFIGQPFVLDGEGVNLELLPSIIFNGIEQIVVKATYNTGVGLAPDDYYILYINSKTNLLDAFKYIVSYPEYFPEGGHAPEKTTVIQGTTKVDGIVFAKGYKTYWSDSKLENGLGEYITNIEVSDISFSPTVEKHFFSAPEGAEILSK
ncbi:hypothetical protein [Neotamlana laminarinivorans]|uniref:Uncharacterized protein n=1 Tax=Neotamlana laminarinivorans TaxID=2883124 RepID=A0A9X1I144_9FLAO|nr:hypothetical protein [Tamlana laminarinivorans]MCB4799879.1 hypothetical protein [Tamlana laminarinivorans]